jgi:predicted amidophosphoribosyltransferase
MTMEPKESFITYLNSTYRHDYLCSYLPLSAGKNALSDSLLKFKRQIRPDLDSWIDYSLEALKHISIPPELIILRALHHDETSTLRGFPTALDILGRTLAGNLGCRYLPCLLFKTRPTISSKDLSRGQRLAELRDVYRVASTIPTLPTNPTSPGQPPPPFLLIDDILTTGTTMRMIIRALRRQFPVSPIRVFTLAKSEYDPKPEI